MNRFNPEIHHRRSIRLKNYDYYQPGAYFITITTYRRDLLFGNITDGTVSLNEYGKIVKSCWERIPHHYPYVILDSLVIMPNHIHGIIILTDNGMRAGLKPAPTGLKSVPAGSVRAGSVRAGLKPAPTTKRHPLNEIVRALKTFSARRINELRASCGVPVWQRNYYEHVIRDEHELNYIREYISTNPLKWALDRENPERTGALSLDRAIFE